MSDYTEWHECPKHGRFVARILDGEIYERIEPVCSICAFEKREAEERRKEAEEQEAKRRRAEQAELAQRELEAQQQRERVIRDANIPQRHASTKLEDFIADARPKQAALDAALRLSPDTDDPVASCIFSGGVGTGKTMLASAIGNENLRNGRTVFYETERGLIRFIRDTWRTGSDVTEKQRLDWLARRALLIIDDVGTSHGSESELVHLFDVIDAVYRNRMQALICTNLDRRALAAHLGERIFDRLRENGLWVSFDWQSARGRKPRKVADIKEGSNAA